MKSKQRLIVTSGPTREFFDPIRFLSNPSTGRMGFHIASAGVKQGFDTVYICGPVDKEYCEVAGARNISIISTIDMMHAVLSQISQDTILIMAAAPADYRPEEKSPVKLKKKESPRINLVPNPDILMTVDAVAKEKRMSVNLIGFAAETHNVEEYARGKLKDKNLELIFLNDVSRSDSGFGVDTNQLTVIRRDGTCESWQTAEKEKLGKQILGEVIKWMDTHNKGIFSSETNERL